MIDRSGGGERAFKEMVAFTEIHKFLSRGLPCWMNVYTGEPFSPILPGIPYQSLGMPHGERRLARLSASDHYKVGYRIKVIPKLRNTP